MWFLAHRVAKPHSLAGYLCAVLVKDGTWLALVKRKLDSPEGLMLFSDKDEADKMAVQLALGGNTVDYSAPAAGHIEVLRVANFQ